MTAGKLQVTISEFGSQSPCASQSRRIGASNFYASVQPCTSSVPSPAVSATPPSARTPPFSQEPVGLCTSCPPGCLLLMLSGSVASCCCSALELGAHTAYNHVDDRCRKCACSLLGIAFAVNSCMRLNPHYADAATIDCHLLILRSMILFWGFSRTRVAVY